MSGIWSEEEKQCASELWANGHSFTEIASKVSEKFGTNRTRASVGGQLFRAGLTGKTPHYTTLRANGRRSINVRQDGARRVKTVVNKNPDPVTVAILTAKDDKPNETSQPILVMRDGKLHANEKLTDACCRFPLGDPAKPGFGFCAKETVPMQSYCEAHMRRVFETVKVKQPVPANDEKVLA